MSMFDVPDLQGRLFDMQQEMCAYHAMLDEIEELKAANEQLECEAAELFKETSTSFYVECYGFLSVARFIHHISQNMNQEFNCEIDIHIDNKGIVERIKYQLKFTHNYLFNTLEPDWDRVDQSAHTLWLYGQNLTITHVKTHQDDKMLMDELDHPARLNVTTDPLTTGIDYSKECHAWKYQQLQ
eukprot:7158274-Ditylum_brightwellii.AAC.1